MTRSLAMALFCLAAAVAGMSRLGDGAFSLGWSLFTGWFFFCLTSSFHEAVHRTLSRWSRFDGAWGRFLGLAMWVPYRAYAESHLRHHAVLNRPEDWELWPYSDPSCSRGFRRAFLAFDLLAGPLSAPWVYGRIFFHPRSPLRGTPAMAAIAREYTAAALVWVAIWLLVARAGAWGDFVRQWWIPLWIAGFLQTLRKLVDHLGLSSFDPMRGARTVVPASRIGAWVSAMNFHISLQGPHHGHPEKAPGWLREHALAFSGDSRVPLLRGYVAAVRQTFAALSVAGVGLNASNGDMLLDRTARRR